MGTAIIEEDHLLRLSSVGLTLAGVTLDSSVYIEAASQALKLAADIVVQEPPPRPLRTLPRREAELRKHLLRGDFIGPPEPGLKRFCINVASIEDALRGPYTVRRGTPPVAALVDYVRNPELPWVVCDIPADRLTPYQRNAGKRANVLLFYVDPAWIVGVNGVPIATFGRLWTTTNAAPVSTAGAPGASPRR